MQRINDVSLLKFRLKQSPAISLLFLLIIIRSHPTFPLINLVRLLLFLILCKCLMLRLYYNYLQVSTSSGLIPVWDFSLFGRQVLPRYAYLCMMSDMKIKLLIIKPCSLTG